MWEVSPVKRNRRRLWFLFAFLAVLCLSAKALSLLEAGNQIDTFPKALWYLVVTLTTVGYGDMVPASLPGRIIGLVFLVGSVGLLSWLIGLLVSFWNGDLRPRLELRRLRGRQWHLFPGPSQAGRLLGEALAREPGDSALLYCGAGGYSLQKQGDHPVLNLPLGWEECLLIAQNPAQVSVYLLGEDGWENILTAQSARGCRVYCQTDGQAGSLPRNAVPFSAAEAVGRLCWRDFPLEPEENTIVLIGGARYGHGVLEQGLLTNVWLPERLLSWHVFGDFETFRQLHYRLSTVMDVDGTGPEGDQLRFYPGGWEGQAALLEQAERIILCLDTDQENLACLQRLQTYVPLKGRVLLRLSRPMEQLNVFASDRDLFSPENVMQGRLYALAREINDIYRSLYHSPDWEELSPFHRRSNLAAADHLAVKASILLHRTFPGGLSREDSAEAALVFRAAEPDRQRRFLWVEHQRWMRFYAMYNWRFDPVRCDALRRHNLMVPFEALSEENQNKDAFSWLLLERYGNAGV